MLMSKERVKSPVVVKAESRLRGMKLVDEKNPKPVNYGSEEEPINVTTLGAKIQSVLAKQDEYNTSLKAASALSNEYEKLEEELRGMCKKVLASAIGLFGDNSNEYEELGGKRKIDRKKHGRNKNDKKGS
jgi:hypothetical protein